MNKAMANRALGKKAHRYSIISQVFVYLSCCHLFFWPMSKQKSISSELRNSLKQKILRSIKQKSSYKDTYLGHMSVL